jgi:hypothetical protein
LWVEFRELPDVPRASLSASPSLVMPVLMSLCLPGWANSSVLRSKSPAAFSAELSQ